ncbi:hypothetical protein [Actinomycetospora sp. CA-084318]|uniref:hypothetical protein n=1 Tax=Actinomycetospora sp. CA-084318 TaxID=3239892 RepID=UPI003D9902CA
MPRWFRRRTSDDDAGAAPSPPAPHRDPAPFTDPERDALAAHGFALFAGRIVLDAEPPLPPARLDEIERACAGPLPTALRELWSTTAGGRLDYDLDARVGDHLVALSWNELFFRGSDGYRDLDGWMAHELELAEDAAREHGTEPVTRLDALPIGGFEYLDRIYVRTAPGPTAGHVDAWVQGLPPGWPHALHGDAVLPLADDLRSALADLHLTHDPLDPERRYGAGSDLLDRLEQARAAGLDPALADRLLAHYREAVVDWRALLDEGRLAEDTRAARLALRHAVTTDDAALVARLHEVGVDLDGPLAGSARATDVALTHDAGAALAALLDVDAAVAPDLLDGIHGPISPDLVRRLLALGARPSGQAVTRCIEHGADASAGLLLAALGDRADEAEQHRARTLADLERTVAEVRSGRAGHYLTIDELETRIERLRGAARS